MFYVRISPRARLAVSWSRTFAVAAVHPARSIVSLATPSSNWLVELILEQASRVRSAAHLGAYGRFSASAVANANNRSKRQPSLKGNDGGALSRKRDGSARASLPGNRGANQPSA